MTKATVRSEFEQDVFPLFEQENEPLTEEAVNAAWCEYIKDRRFLKQITQRTYRRWCIEGYGKQIAIA